MAKKPYEISAPAVMLIGDPGMGKTYSLATLAASPKIDKLFYLYTDPGGDESLIDACQMHDVPLSKIHWHYVAPAAQGWEAMEELANKVNMMNYQSLADLKTGIDKSEHRQMFQIIAALHNFHCQRTGENFGDASEWGQNYAVAFDSFTGLNKIARETTVGAKPTLHMGEWGTAMSLEENFIRKFVSDINCPRVMIGHLDKIMDEIQGRMTLQVSLLGNKLAPQIPHLFSDVVYAYREGSQFYWSTADDRVTTKTRNLPIGNKLSPDFKQILDRWHKRQAYAQTVEIETGSVTDAG